jgi:sulfur-oxidizing protein SoxY
VGTLRQRLLTAALVSLTQLSVASGAMAGAAPDTASGAVAGAAASGAVAGAASGAASGSVAGPVAGDNDEAERATRWQALQQALFPGRSMKDGAGIVMLEAPPRALDAALVPIGIDLSSVKPIKSVYLVIDGNPSPLAGHFTFGPKADPHSLKLRVRVDQYTYMHAIAESQDGQLFVATKFVKASGGCSAPAGGDDAAALQDIGQMKLRLVGNFVPGKPDQAVLMVRHPNFNGMQMNQITRYYTPPRFIRTIDATYEGSSIFHLDSDISMSTDPVITFGFVPQGKGAMKIVVRDSKDATFDHSFEVPGSGNAVAGTNNAAPGA